MPMLPVRRRPLQCRGLLAPPYAGQSRFALASDFMTFSQRGAGTEDGGHGEKETADRCAESRAHHAGKHRRSAAKDEAGEIFIPPAFLQR